MESGHKYFQKTGRAGEVVLKEPIFINQIETMSKNKFGGSWTEEKMNSC